MLSDEQKMLEPMAIALQMRRRALRSRQMRAVGICVFVCVVVVGLAGVALHMKARNAERELYEADMSAFQGTWEVRPGCLTVIVQGSAYQILPDPPRVPGKHGTFVLSVATVPKTVDFLWQEAALDVHRDVFTYSVGEDTISMRLVADTGPNGAIQAAPEGLIMVWSRTIMGDCGNVLTEE